MDIEDLARDIPFPEALGRRIIAACRSAESSKLHHYVPQSFMQAWQEEGHVKVWDTLEGKTFLSDTRNVCAESDYFKTVMPDEEETRAVEGLFSVVDGEFARLLGDIRSSGDLPADGSENKVSLAYLLSLQALRVPQRRRIFNELADYVIKLESESRLHDLGVDPDTFRIEAHNNSHIRTMSETAREVFPDWAARTWTLITSENDDFVTCDSPVLWDGLTGTPVGLVAVPEILVPLSPRTVLSMTHGESPSRSLAQVRQQVEFLTIRSRDRWIIGTPSQAFFSGRDGKTIPRRRQLKLECVQQYEPKDGRGSCLMAHTAVYAKGPVIETCGRHR